MFFQQRRYRVTHVVSIEDLVRSLTERSWTLCQAFAIADLLLVNDATSEDGAQEYAVIRDGRLIESVTVSWCEADQLLAILRELEAGGGGDYAPAPVRLDHPDGVCP